MKTMNTITAGILNSIGAKTPAHTISVDWANGTRASYPADMLDLIRTDAACVEIMDNETGEILYAMGDADTIDAADADAAETGYYLLPKADRDSLRGMMNALEGIGDRLYDSAAYTDRRHPRHADAVAASNRLLSILIDLVALRQ